MKRIMNVFLPAPRGSIDTMSQPSSSASVMHLLILASFAPSLLNFRGPLIRTLLARGYRVSVGAPDVDAETRQALEALGAEVHETPLSRNGTGMLADLTYMRSLRRLIRTTRPDTVLTYTIKPNIWGAFAAASCRVPSTSMVTGLGFAFVGQGGTWKNRAARWAARRLYRAATTLNGRVIFQNPDDRNDFIAAGCLADPDKCVIVDGSGVDLDHFTPAPMVDAPVFLMIARLLRSKGVSEYLEAAKHVRSLHPAARFLLVGAHDGGPDAVDHFEIDSAVASGTIEWFGSLDDVRPAIALAAIYVLPSYREGTPRSVLEAMAMGRAIITTDVPGCRETIRNGVEGLLVPPRNSAALAKAMDQMIKSPEMVAVMGANALDRVRGKYAVDRVNQQVIAALGLGSIS
jgi:glycosyltransferase involved in cell wall biosynthesis